MDTTDETTPGFRIHPGDDVEGHLLRSGRASASGRDGWTHPADATQPPEAGEDVEAHSARAGHSVKDEVLEGGKLDETEIGFPFRRIG